MVNQNCGITKTEKLNRVEVKTGLRKPAQNTVKNNRVFFISTLNFLSPEIIKKMIQVRRIV